MIKVNDTVRVCEEQYRGYEFIVTEGPVDGFFQLEETSKVKRRRNKLVITKHEEVVELIKSFKADSKYNDTEKLEGYEF